MFDRRGSKRDTDIGALERRWIALILWCSGYVGPVGLFDMPLLRHDQEVE